ncbi:C-C chemokine receptor type 5-like protein [Labeo rohita]|uniref:C-C chemokine receptor type 5-like protein n=1 Tax=Labeo rohita TaxID=84645 RepID=A0A498NBQ8_LABRO|nr:C-C chemokine receptor type 5-like protein [Labeo rohita]
MNPALMCFLLLPVSVLAATTSDYSEYYDNSNDYGSSCNDGNPKPFIRVFFPILYSTAFIVGLIGNALVLWVLIRNRQRSSLTDVCFLNLALCDLLFVASLPFWAHSAAQEWVFGTFACHAVSGLVMMGLYGSVFFMVLMTLDRYVIMVYKRSICSRRRAKIALALFVWMLSLFVSLPNIVFAKVKNENNIITCGTEFPDSSGWTFMYLNVLSLILPLIIVSFCFCRIISIKSEEKHGVIRLLVAVLAVYFLFWTPYNVVMFFKFLQMKGFFGTCEWHVDLSLAMPFVEAIALSHCCLNPIIYTCVGQKFRRAVLTGPKEQFPSTCSPQSPDYSSTLIA